MILQIQVLKSKIHTAKVTEAELEYEGSIGIDEDIMKLADIREHEKVLVINFKNGKRYETYAIKAKAGSKTIAVNGAGALYSELGDPVTIISFGLIDCKEDTPKPTVLILDDNNNIKNI